MIKNIHFVKDGSDIEVQQWTDSHGYDWNTLGLLVFDDEQNAWVFWQASEQGDNIYGGVRCADGVTYLESLKETEETIKQEFQEN